MRVCVVSFKECWKDESGRWLSSGGFPLQTSAVGSLFDEMTLLVVEVQPQPGGIPLPEHARVVPLAQPAGRDTRRKLSVLWHLPYYATTILRNERRADVVHVPLPADISFLGLIGALLLRKRLIARYGGSWSATSQTTVMGTITKRIMRAFAGGRNVMLATGAGDNAPAINMHWLFATAITQREVSSIQPDLNRPLSSPARLAYVGRLSPEKGVVYLVESLAILRRMLAADGHPERLPHLTLIGDGPQRHALEASVEKHDLVGHVCFTGQLDREELVRHLLSTDLCVLPSLTESFCKARLDAMLCGVPVMTTEVGFGREIVGNDGERGWVVPAQDAEALALGTRQVLLANIEWPALRERCRQYVDGRTLETWALSIGEICAQQWHTTFAGGRLGL